MKIVILSKYPIKEFKEELGIKEVGFEHPYTWVKNLAHYLSLIPGNEVHIMTMRRDIPKDASIFRNKIYFHFLSSPNRILNYFSLTYSSLLKIKNKLKKIKPDIVHGQGTDRFSYYAIHSGYPNVITIHGVNIDFKNSLGSQIRRRELYFDLLLEKKCFKKAKNIICISPYLYKFFNEFKTSAKIFDIENPINEIYFQNYDIMEENYLLYVGSITPRKRFLDILLALKDISNVKLKVISFGITPEQYKKEIYKFINNNKLEKRIEFLGYQDEKGIFENMKKCKIVLLPSGAETAPMVIAEAMAAGKPVIATAVGGVPFMIKNGITGFTYNVGDVDTLRNFIILLLNNDKLRFDMGKKAKELAYEKYEPFTIAKKTMKAYKEILQS